MLPPAWIMVLLHFWVGLSLYVIPEGALQELERPQQLLPPPPFLSKVNTLWTSWPAPKGKPLGSHMVGWKYPDTSTMIGRTIRGRRVHCKSSARKVTHTSTIPALGGLTAKFPRDPGWGRAFKPILQQMNTLNTKTPKSCSPLKVGFVGAIHLHLQRHLRWWQPGHSNA